MRKVKVLGASKLDGSPEIELPEGAEVIDVKSGRDGSRSYLTVVVIVDDGRTTEMTDECL